MNRTYDEIMQLIGADEFKALIRKWDTLSSNLKKVPRELPTLLPDLLWVCNSGNGRTKLMTLMSEYLYAKENLIDFCGDGKFLEFLLDYVPKEAPFTQLQRLEDELAAVKGFRNEFRGAILIDIDAWVEHYRDRYFISFLEYLSAHSEHWMIVLSVSSRPETELQELQAFLSVYLRLERLNISTPKAEELYIFVEKNLRSYGLVPDSKGKALLLQTIAVLRDNPHFDGFKTLIMLCQDIAYQHFSSANAAKTSLSEQALENFAPDSAYVKKTISNAATKHRIGFAFGEE